MRLEGRDSLFFSPVIAEISLIDAAGAQETNTSLVDEAD